MDGTDHGMPASAARGRGRINPRLAALALAALLLGGSERASAQDALRGDSATIAATGHGRLELNMSRDREAGDGGSRMQLSLDARIAARMGVAAGAATVAIILGAGGLASRRRRGERGAGPSAPSHAGSG